MPDGARFGFVVPARRDRWPNFGLLALLVAAGGLLSGLLLALHYAPTLDAARASVAHLQEEVALGRWLRGAHHWAGTFALVLAALHGARLFWHGCYKAPRRTLWVLGCLILLVLVGFAYTGYLLAGDERAYTGMGVMEGVAASTPVVGEAVSRVLKGGPAISSATLARLYAVHSVLLPFALAALVAAFVVAWRRVGPARRFDDAGTDVAAAWPAAVARDATWALGVLALLALLAVLAPPGLGPAPDLASGEGAPNARPEWFFLWVNELLHLVAGSTFVIAGLLPQLLAGLAILLPWLARGTERAPGARKPELIAAGVIVAALAGLTVVSLASAPPAAEVEGAGEEEPGAGAAEGRSIDEQVQPILRRFRCARCHSIDGAEAEQESGPPLWREAHEERPAFGKLYTRELFRRKVGDPRKFWPDTGMYYTPKRLKPTRAQLDVLERWFFDRK